MDIENNIDIIDISKEYQKKFILKVINYKF